MPNPNKTFSRVGSERAEFVPLAFVAGSGEITQPKLELVNSMLCDWQVDLQLKRKPKAGGKKECPFYSPSTQNQLLRTFYSHMGEHHGWRFSENNFKGWKGCVNGLLVQLYAQRLKLYVSQLKWVLFLFIVLCHFNNIVLVFITGEGRLWEACGKIYF